LLVPCSIEATTMDSLPPNDPNNNQNNTPPHNQGHSKEAPYDGRQLSNQRGGSQNGSQAGGGSNNERMDMVGDLRDSPVVVAMFLVGVVSWFIREHCVC
jgi:hypothetical protein